MSLKPTVEQAAAIDAFQLGRNLKVNAYAGTGKTSTLQMMAESVDRKGTYIAFNRSIADEAGRRFPASVKALTSHALAYRSIIQTGFSSGKMTGKLNANAIAQRLNLSALPIDSHHRLSVRQHAHVISETIRLFTQSDMEKIGPELVPMLGSLAKTDPDSLVELRKKIADVATGLWEKMISPKQEEYPLGHDGYFKLWANSMPQIPRLTRLG